MVGRKEEFKNFLQSVISSFLKQKEHRFIVFLKCKKLFANLPDYSLRIKPT